MKRTVLLLALLSVVVLSVSAQNKIDKQLVIQSPTASWGNPTDELLWLPDDYNTNTSARYPLIIFLHGWGESGKNLKKVTQTALPMLIAKGFKPSAVNPKDGKTYKFIVVSPQAPDFSYQYTHVRYILADILKRYRVDESRIYITGLSAGGYGTWTCTTDDAAFCQKIAAIAPVSSMAVDGSRINEISNAGKYGVGVWSICGMLDDKYAAAITYTNRINNSNPKVKAKLTGVRGMGHTRSLWNKVYDPSWRVDGMNLYEWMLQFSRNGVVNTPVPDTKPPVPPVVINQAPVAKAGANQTITLPSNRVQLSGSGTDADGSITAYNWTKTSGPASFTINNATVANPVINNLVEGTYVFRLTVRDNKGATASDNVSITVKASPTPSSGSAHAIPGKIEAENYTNMSGVQKETTEGASGQDVGYINAGDWVDYKVNVTKAGNYSFIVRAASPDGSQLQLKTANGTVLTTVSIPATGMWRSWATATATVSLPTGIQTIRVYATKAGWNFDWMQFTFTTTIPVTPPSTPSGDSRTIQVNVFGGSNPYNNTGWNNWNVPSSNNALSIKNLKYSDGTISTVDATLSNSTGIADNGTNYSGTMAPDNVLRFASYSTNNRTLTLSGLSTSKKYTLEFYASRDANAFETTIFSINGISKVVNTYNNLTNKAVFTSVTPNAQGKIVVSLYKSSIRTYNYLNGFVLSEITTSSTNETGLNINNKQLDLTDASSNPVNGLSLYPNPVKDHVMLQVGSTATGIMNVKIVAMDGGVRKELHLVKDQPQALQSYLSVSDLPAGSYILQVQIGQWNASQKFIKQ